MIVVITYVAIGVLPRTLGRQHPYTVGLALAGPTRGLAKVLSPVASLLILIGNAITPGRGFREGPFSSDVELRELVDIAGSSGVVEETEREMLQSVFDLGDTIVREVMVPRTEVVWIERDKTLLQALHLATRSGFSRIPVVGEDVDDVVGVVYIKDMIARALSLGPGESGPPLTELMRVPVFVPESKNVDALLREMQRDRTHFALVVDEYGGLAGIVTIEDLLEEIVGEITDEYDADTPAPIEPLSDGRYRVSARLSVEDLGELFDVELPDDDVDTVGGLLAQLLGRVPLPGSEATISTLHLLGEPGVDRRGRPRVQTLLVRRLTAEELGEEAAQEAAEREADRVERADRADREEKAERAERREKSDKAEAEKRRKSEKADAAKKAAKAAARAEKARRAQKAAADRADRDTVDKTATARGADTASANGSGPARQAQTPEPEGRQAQTPSRPETRDRRPDPEAETRRPEARPPETPVASRTPPTVEDRTVSR